MDEPPRDNCMLICASCPLTEDLPFAVVSDVSVKPILNHYRTIHSPEYSAFLRI